MKAKLYLVLSGVSFGIFFILALLAQARRFMYPDLVVTQFLQTVVGRQFDIPLSLFSLLGSGEVTSVILLAVFAYIVWKKKHFAIELFVTFTLLHIIELICKYFLYHPGPPSFFFRYSIPFYFPSVNIQPGYSFPSGHVARTIFLATIIAVLVHQYAKNKVQQKTAFVVLGAISLIMIGSRVYLGEHWFSDVLGGTALGFSMATLALARGKI